MSLLPSPSLPSNPVERCARVGDDIVDLSPPDVANKAKDERFVARVFCDSERRLIESSQTPSPVLWTLWAAKESAYKVLKKLDPDTVFAHRRFEVIPGDVSFELGVVRFDDRRFPVQWQMGQGYVHCVCRSRYEGSRVLFAIADVPPGEQESRAVRNLARSLIAFAGFPSDAEIIRPLRGNRLGAPEVMVRGQAVDGIDLSMSHDGRFASAGVSF